MSGITTGRPRQFRECRTEPPSDRLEEMKVQPLDAVGSRYDSLAG
jgi:hypothetical protein